MNENESILDNVNMVRANIQRACERVGRNPDEVTLIAVSKTKPADAIRLAVEAGVMHFGENRVEEASVKRPQVRELTDAPLTWHMIGNIQSRKAKQVTALFDMVHSVDSVKLAQKLSEHALAVGRTLPILLEVNASGEASKHGFFIHEADAHPERWAQWLKEVDTLLALRGLSLQGLMTMAPYFAEAEATRPVFRTVAQAQRILEAHAGQRFPVLSMGMTNDYEIAIEEGATHVRVGRAIFGER
jgi:pyridoxal phosphate enzyme (YggS family)